MDATDPEDQAQWETLIGRAAIPGCSFRLRSEDTKRHTVSLSIATFAPLCWTGASFSDIGAARFMVGRSGANPTWTAPGARNTIRRLSVQFSAIRGLVPDSQPDIFPASFQQGVCALPGSQRPPTQSSNAAHHLAAIAKAHKAAGLRHSQRRCPFYQWLAARQRALQSSALLSIAVLNRRSGSGMPSPVPFLVCGQ